MGKTEHNLLSDREEQVLLLSTKGLTDKEIARKLNLSIATVNTERVHVIRSSCQRHTERSIQGWSLYPPAGGATMSFEKQRLAAFL